MRKPQAGIHHPQHAHAVGDVRLRHGSRGQHLNRHPLGRLERTLETAAAGSGVLATEIDAADRDRHCARQRADLSRAGPSPGHLRWTPRSSRNAARQA